MKMDMNTCRTYPQWPTLPNTKQAWFKSCWKTMTFPLSVCIICHLHPAMWVLLQRIPLLHHLQISQQIAILPKTWLVGAFGNPGELVTNDFGFKEVYHLYIYIYLRINTSRLETPVLFWWLQPYQFIRVDVLYVLAAKAARAATAEAVRTLAWKDVEKVDTLPPLIIEVTNHQS